MKIIGLDYETFYDKDEYSVGKLAPHQYVNHPQFDPYLMTICDGETTWSGHPKDFNYPALEGALLVSHNSFFDMQVARGASKLLGVPRIQDWMPEWPGAETANVPVIPTRGWICSANLACRMLNVRSLGKTVKYAYGEDISKDVRARMNKKHFHDAVTEGFDKELIEYARRDAYWCQRFAADYLPQWSTFEQRLSDLTLRNAMRGCRVNVPLLDRYLEICDGVLTKLEKNLPWVERGLALTSTKGLAEECRKVGIPCPPVKKYDEEGFDAWEEKFGTEFLFVKAVGQYRRVNKMFVSLQTLRARVRPDDTVETPLLYFNAHCFTGEHEVLTPEGWVRLDRWTGGKILQYKAGQLLFDDATSNRLFCTDPELLHAKSGQVEFVATPGHWAATLNKAGAVIKRQVGEVCSHAVEIPLSGQYSNLSGITLPDWMAKLFVAIQADGHYFSDCRSIRFRFTKPRKIERLRKILQKSPLDWNEAIYPSEPTVTVFVIRQYPPELENRKRWTSELLGWNGKTLETILLELVHWDGFRAGPSTVEYCTTVEENADWVVTLAHLTGRAATITRRYRTADGWSDSYRVFIRSRSQTRLQPKNWARVSAPETVYCPTSKHGLCLFRFRGQIFVSGQTGRWAGGDGFNLQNMRKESFYLRADTGIFEFDEDRVEELEKLWAETPEEHREEAMRSEGVSAVLNLRWLFIAREGMKLVICDLAQIEPRVLNWLAGNFPMLEMMKGGMSPYEAYARTQMGYTDSAPLKKADPKRYKYVKAAVLGLGYGCGDERYVKVAWTLAKLRLSQEEATEAVAEFRARNPLILEFWNQLDGAARSSLSGDRELKLELPSGREMVYRDLVYARRPKFNKKTGKIESRSEILARVGDRRTGIYGGKLAENVTQAISRDVFGEHLLALDDAGAGIPFHVHDEAPCEVPEDTDPRDVEHIMSQTPDWLPGCPIGAEAVESQYYKK